MSVSNSTRAESLEKHISTLLLLTGVLYVLAAVNTGIVLIYEGYSFQTLSAPLLLIGLLASLLAIIGIYSRGRDEAPTVAKATGVLAGLGLLFVIVLLIWGIVNELGGAPSTPAPVALVALVLFILSFVTGGITVLQSAIYNRLVGYLLIVEALALILVFVIPAVVYQGEAPPEATILIELVQAVIVLWAGQLIRGQ